MSAFGRRPMIALLVLMLLLALLLGWLLLGRLERSMLFHPTPLSGISPQRFGLTHQDVVLTASDGVRLQAWWFPRPEVEAGAEPSAPLLLFLHGNAGNREDRLHNVQGLWQAGISVLIPDYRGYGGSAGSPSEAGLLRDAEAAYRWLLERGGGRPVFVFGRSLGGAVAARLALALSAHRGDDLSAEMSGDRSLGRALPPAGLILESTFTSAPEMAGRVLPLPGIRYLVRTQLNAREAVARLDVPLLVIHGTHDALVPLAMGRALFDAARTRDKRFYEVPGGGHNDTYLVAGEGYYPALLGFLRAHGE